MTDCGQNRIDGASLLNGYAMRVVAWLTVAYPALGLRFLNPSIS